MKNLMRNENAEVYYKEYGDKILFLNAKNGAWGILKNEENIREQIFERSRFYKELLEMDFFIQENLIEKPALDTMNLFIIDTTDKCNLRCEYCSAEASAQGKSLTLEIAVGAFRNFLGIKNINSCVTIEFSGGEPLLNFSLIEQIVPIYKEIAKANGVSLSFTIQTNGTLLTEKVVDFLVGAGFTIGISIDGSEKWNINRRFENQRPAFNSVDNNIKYLIDNNIPFSILSVVWSPSQYRAILEYADKTGIKNIRVNPMSEIGRGKRRESKEILEYSYKEYAEAYLEFAKRIILDPQYAGIREANLTNYLWSLLLWQPHMCFRSPCGAGRNQLHLTAYGEIFPCQDLRSIQDKKICDWDEVDIAARIREHDRCNQMATRDVDKQAGCKECAWRRYCGTCQRELITAKKDENGQISLCKFNNMVLEGLIWLMDAHEERVLQYLGVNVK